MLDRSRSGDGCFEAGGLRNQPVRHIAAITVAANRQLIRIGETVLHQSIDSSQYVFARPRNYLGNNSERELISIARRAAIIRLKHKPARGSGETIPLVPIGFEVVAIRILRTAVDEYKRRQVFRFKFSWRIHQHAFNGSAIVGGPAVGLRLWKIALGK